MKWYFKVLKNYAVFNGRASRTEYWMFVLFYFIFAFLVGAIEGLLGTFAKTDQSVLGNIYLLAMQIPVIAVSCRRMHDIDRSGWWIIVPIVSLIFSLKEGTKGDNKFGPDPWGNSQY